MTKEELSAIYDTLSDHDRRIVGLIGIGFVCGLITKIKDVLNRD